MIDGAYFHEGPNKKFAIILLTDIFGLPLVNSKLLVSRLYAAPFTKPDISKFLG